MGDTLKLSFGLAMQATGGVGWQEEGGHGGVLMGKGGSHSLVLLY